MTFRFPISILLFSLALPLTGAEDPVVPPPKNQDPEVAERGYFSQYPKAWNDFHKQFLERSKQGGIDLLFLGDSITQGWGDAAQKDLWKNYFEPYKAANFGVGGDRTQQVLWRITNGELDGIAPKVIVLSIGVNNLWVNDSAEKIAEATKKIVQLIHQKLPNARILLVGILPSAQRNGVDAIREKIRQINAASAKLDDGKTIRFLDAGLKLLDSYGNIAAESDLYQPDNVHLKTKGYEVLAIAIKPVLIEMLK